ncbi:MAG: NFACT RNA binding domain-containing protein [Gemmatimonadetes bacterium]|nr:NFACT RNA binding domain-containing protein [Gemmatimonadota bacterium]
MPLRWDPLLVRHLARELDRGLRGARLRAIRLDGSTRFASLLFREATLSWPLHPSRGAPRLLEPADPTQGDLALSGRVRGVRAPEDERVLVVEILPTRGRPRSVDIVVELLGNQWNLVVAEGPDARIRHVLVRRNDRRTLVVGAAYEPPTPSRREGSSEPFGFDRWREILAGVAASERGRTLVRAVAWTSPVNAPVLAPEDVEADTDTFRSGYALWRRLAFDEVPPSPVLLRSPGGAQPYPWPLPGIPSTETPSLLDAFALWEKESVPGGAVGAALLPPDLLSDLQAVLDRARRRTTSLQAELAAVEDPARLRASGDLLLARLASVPEGVAEVVLEDFEGNPVALHLDPRVAPHANAALFYERAARAERARSRLPALIAEAEARVTLMEDLTRRARAGEADGDEVRAALPEEERHQGAGGGGATSMLPYRRYRSSGGLEIRVGRGAKHNDELTFRHSSPNDVWLHARHAAGAHVVLRWGRTETPPAQDLQEAAVLAALHSRARTSSSVPVDWTFRKYVRKPRGSPPGRVTMERARTLFVSPDPEWEEALQGTSGPE